MQGIVKSLPKFNRREYLNTLRFLNKNQINTVCLEANCPNRYECFANKTATFMILGNICTRNCKYCNINNGIPKPLDNEEPKKIAEAIKKFNLSYAVITCVTRDDLKDKGTLQFAKTISLIKQLIPSCKVEVLISDNIDIKKIMDADVINHNIEATKSVFNLVRPQGNYNKSLSLLKSIKEIDPNKITKSGLMLGFGESFKEILETIKDLRKVKVDILTIGQYLQPSLDHYPVKKHYSETEFLKLQNLALDLGFKVVFSGPLIRSSYHAEQAFKNIRSNKNETI